MRLKNFMWSVAKVGQAPQSLSSEDFNEVFTVNEEAAWAGQTDLRWVKWSSSKNNCEFEVEITGWADTPTTAAADWESEQI